MFASQIARRPPRIHKLADYLDKLAAYQAKFSDLARRITVQSSSFLSVVHSIHARILSSSRTNDCASWHSASVYDRKPAEKDDARRKNAHGGWSIAKLEQKGTRDVKKYVKKCAV